MNAEKLKRLEFSKGASERELVQLRISLNKLFNHMKL